MNFLRIDRIDPIYILEEFPLKNHHLENTDDQTVRQKHFPCCKGEEPDVVCDLYHNILILVDVMLRVRRQNCWQKRQPEVANALLFHLIYLTCSF